MRTLTSGHLLRSIGIFGVLAMIASGCADVRPGQTASSAEREAALSLVSQLDAMTAQPTGSTEILQAASFAPVLAFITPPGTPIGAPGEASYGADLTGCLITTDTSVTLTECEVSDHVVDGTWSAQGSSVHAEFVDVFMTGPASHGSVALNANLTWTATTRGLTSPINGTVNTGVMWTVGDGDYAVDASIRVDNLVIETPRCATSGTISITGGLIDAQPQGVTLWFGPGCRDVHIARN